VAAGDDPAGSGTVQRRDAPAGASEAGARDAAVSKIRLDPAQRAEFERAIKAGAANHELAARFGLTPRQAHGFRIGFARRKATPGPATLGNKASPHVEATERLQQEIFLRQRPPQPPVMDDVVRFLRQQDDIVVRNGDGFLVNARLLLSAQELVARANAKRIALGKPPFSIDMRPNGGNLSLVVRPRDDKLPDASRA
jgi:hypothetical protein